MHNIYFDVLNCVPQVYSKVPTLSLTGFHCVLSFKANFVFPELDDFHCENEFPYNWDSNLVANKSQKKKENPLFDLHVICIHEMESMTHQGVQTTGSLTEWNHIMSYIRCIHILGLVPTWEYTMFYDDFSHTSTYPLEFKNISPIPLHDNIIPLCCVVTPPQAT